jgi:hypothetical protein
MAEKKNKTKRQTKAGMLENGGENEREKDKTESGKDSENPPKISKEKAEQRDDDRPLH